MSDAVNQHDYSHSFNVKVAMECGVDGAIMLDNIAFWIRRNIANRTHFHYERYWTYNSLRAFGELFPYWSKRQLERLLDNLVEKGYLMKDNFNKKLYDRTAWYALTDIGLELLKVDVIKPSENIVAISPNGEMDITKRGNAIHQTVTPIPDTITDTITNNRSIDSQLNAKQQNLKDLISKKLSNDTITKNQLTDMLAKTCIETISKSLDYALADQEFHKKKKPLAYFVTCIINQGYYPDPLAPTYNKKPKKSIEVSEESTHASHKPYVKPSDALQAPKEAYKRKGMGTIQESLELLKKRQG